MPRTVLLAIALVLAACGASSPRSSSATCPEGGVPDDGDAEGCEIRVGACCYATQAPACAAAGCPPDRCVVLESYPGQIACE